MKKSLSVLLFISLIIVSLISCNTAESPQNNPGDTTATDSTPTFTDPINDYDTIDETSTDGFTIKAKKYNYEENNVVLLSVENQSENNYTVTVDLTYYDDTGKEITKESQSFEGFAANWQKYFLFKPDKAFSSYEYKLTTENFSGECLGNKFTYKFVGVEENRGPIEYHETEATYGRIIYGHFSCKYEYSESLEYLLTGIYFDNKGEIFYIAPMRMVGGRQPYEEDDFNQQLVIGNKDSVEWPEELKGEVNGILILNNIGIGSNPPPSVD